MIRQMFAWIFGIKAHPDVSFARAAHPRDFPSGQARQIALTRPQSPAHIANGHPPKLLDFGR